MNIFYAMHPMIGFSAALAGTLALTPVARQLARRLGVVDCPNGRRNLQLRPLALVCGVAGPASTPGLSTAVVVAATAWGPGADDTAMLALPLAGAFAGFRAFNCPPASIYLGGAGSMVIGMALSILSLAVAHDALGRTSL